jgi:HPt (histidine-containing phosphotransfer) domain-containing protein
MQTHVMPGPGGLSSSRRAARSGEALVKIEFFANGEDAAGGFKLAVDPALPLDADDPRAFPLIDHSVVTLLECLMDPDEFAMTVRLGMQFYAEHCANLRAAVGTPAVIRREAQALVASAENLGVARLGAIAARIEAQADDPAAMARLLPQLEKALRGGRKELVALGMLEPEELSA